VVDDGHWIFEPHHNGMKRTRSSCYGSLKVKAWKAETQGVSGLKDVHGLQLALHLPDGSENRR